MASHPSHIASVFCSSVFRHTEATREALEFARALEQPVIAWEWSEPIEALATNTPLADSPGALSEALLDLLFPKTPSLGQNWIEPPAMLPTSTPPGLRGVDVWELDFAAHAHLYTVGS